MLFESVVDSYQISTGPFAAKTSQSFTPPIPFQSVPPQGHALLCRDRTEHFRYTAVLYFSVAKGFYSFHFPHHATHIIAFTLPLVTLSPPFYSLPSVHIAFQRRYASAPFRYNAQLRHSDTKLLQNVSELRPNVTSHINALAPPFGALLFRHSAYLLRFVS